MWDKQDILSQGGEKKEKRIEQFRTIDGGGEQTSDYNYKRCQFTVSAFHIKCECEKKRERERKK